MLGDPGTLEDLLDDRDGKRVIAAIGIDRYRSWPRLNNAVNDARGALAAFARVGFAPIGEPLCDDAATFDAMRRLVTDELSQLGRRDSLIVFFAGHGHNVRRTYDDGDASTTGYLIPADADASDASAARWLCLEHWLSDLGRLAPRHILVVLDACYSGIALGPLIKWRAQVGQTRALAALARRRSRRVITSALDDQRAMDSGPRRGHSLFTGCLIDALEGAIAQPGAWFTGTELALYVQRRVTTYPDAQQTPDSGAFEQDKRGELVFRLPAAPGETAPVAGDAPRDAGPALPPEPRPEPPGTAPRNRRRPGTGAKAPVPADRADVAVLVALEEEFAQLAELAGFGDSIPDDHGGAFFPFAVEGPAGAYRCIATLIGDMGISAARGPADRMLDRWRPAVAVMIGIAASLSDDVKLGDLVVASQIDAYDAKLKAVTAASRGGFEFLHRGLVYRADGRLLAAIRDLRFAHPAALSSFEAACSTDAESLLVARQRAKLQQGKSLGRSPSVHRGHVASGSILGASTEFRDWLHLRDQSIIALEMEGAALAAAAADRQPQIPALVLRGISDFGDDRKRAIDAISSGGVRRYAMRNAVRYLLLLAQLGALPRHDEAQ
jgi:nucleoside phosphorylase